MTSRPTPQPRPPDQISSKVWKALDGLDDTGLGRLGPGRFTVELGSGGAWDWRSPAHQPTVMNCEGPLEEL